MIRTHRLTKPMVSALLWSHLHSEAGAEARIEEIDEQVKRLEAEREALHTTIRQHKRASWKLRWKAQVAA